MDVSPSSLIRAAGAAAIAAGALFIGVQIGHPALDLAFITTTEAAVRNTLKVLMAVLALVGITGMYLSQVRSNGVLGLVGYLILATGYLLIMSSTFGLAYMLPPIAGADPAFVSDVLASFKGGTPGGDIGVLGAVFQIQSLCYLAGGVLFGVALFRARVLSRWAATLLAVGGLVSAALSLLPDALYRLIAFPNGIALIGLGYSLWRTQRRTEELMTGARQAHCRAQPRPMNTRIPTWLVPSGLVALGAVPVIAGSLRLAELTGGTAALPSDDRYTASPLPVTLHIVCGAVFAIVGAFQFAPGVRRSHPGWHRRAGRVLVAAGLGVALVGAVVEPVPPARRGHPGGAVPAPDGVRSGNGRHPRPRIPGGPPRRLPTAPGVDGPQLRHRPRRRHPGLHPRHRRCVLRDRTADHRAPPGRGVGDQPGGRGAGHP